METGTTVDIISAGIALLALVVAYFADRRTKRTSELTTQLSFQTKKNELGLELTKQLAADQARVEQARRKLEEYEQVTEEAEALGVQELSDAVRARRSSMRQAYHEQVESGEGTLNLQEAYEDLDKLSPERETSESLIQLEAVKGKVQKLAMDAQKMDASLASLISSFNELIEAERDLIEMYRGFTEDNDSPEEQEDNDSPEEPPEGTS
jgi:hypothetical protein